MGRGNLQTNSTLALHIKDIKESFAEKNGYLNPVAVWEQWGISGPSRFPSPPLR